MLKINTLEELVRVYTLSSIDELNVFLNEIDEKELSNKPSSNDYINIKTIFEKVGFPVCVICEFEYVDRMYRDMYYSYYSGKHDEKK